MPVIPKLSLNKHPRACVNLSLATALNIKVDKDMTCITNEESIRENECIKNALQEYKIVGWIPCNNEVVIFAIKKSVKSYPTTDTGIFRYVELNSNIADKEQCTLVYEHWKYNGGKNITGAFTYNVEGSLIITFSEYNFDDSSIRVPLKTINLGNLKDADVENDLNLPDELIACCPEVQLPICKNLQYTNDITYKGWYYLFIRFKINSVDYTQWFPIGFPIYIDFLQQQNIMKYGYSRRLESTRKDHYKVNIPDSIDIRIAGRQTEIVPDGYVAGCSDSFSTDDELVEKSFSVVLEFDKSSLQILSYYKYIQIGWICKRAEDNVAYTTNDIAIDVDSNEDNFEYIFRNHLQNMIESTEDELTQQYQNYFNVKTVVNYKNKIYIANYKERNINDKTITQNEENVVSGINVDLKSFNFACEDNGYEFNNIFVGSVLASSSDIKVYEHCTGYHAFTGKSRYIRLDEYLNINPNNKISIIEIKGNAENEIRNGYASSYALVIYQRDDDNKSLMGYPYGFCKIIEHDNDVINDISKEKVSYSVRVEDTNNVVKLIDYSESGGKYFSLGVSNVPYIEPIKSFYDRCNRATLLPGEIYNFFIHFVDKYGNSSNGYQIQNNNKWKTQASDEEITPVLLDPDDETKCAAIPFEWSVYDTLHYLITGEGDGYTDKLFCSDISFEEGNYIINSIPDFDETMKQNFIEKYFTFYDEKYKDVYWWQVAILPKVNFGMFRNTKGDRLFKIPFSDIDFSDSSTSTNKIDEMDGFDYKRQTVYTQYCPFFKNIKLPEDGNWIGFFISTEKMEKQTRATGLLTRSDFMSLNFIDATKFKSGAYRIFTHNANAFESDKMCFYSQYFDIEEDAKSDFNMIRLEGKNIFKESDIYPYEFIQRSKAYTFLHDQNKPQIKKSSHIQSIGIKNFKVCVAHDEKENRYCKGTVLSIDNVPGLFDHTLDGTETVRIGTYEGEAKDETNAVKHAKALPNTYRASNNILYKASVLNISDDIYTNDTKELIRISDVKYIDQNKTCNARLIRGLNGRYTITGSLVYNNQGVYFNNNNSGMNKIVTTNGIDRYYPTRPVMNFGASGNMYEQHNEERNEMSDTFCCECPFVAYMQMPVCDDKLHESKIFNTPPSDYPFISYGHDDSADYDQYVAGCVVEPQNSPSLFKNPIGRITEGVSVTYLNFNRDLVSLDEFNKTIHRSAVIQDESRENGWRLFDLEDYKFISENKGDITNLIGMNKILFVHTEHALFMLSGDSTLQAENKEVELAAQDVFDVNYSEVVTSELGYAGLQDKKSYVFDQFGYIFYDNDNNRFYQLAGKEINNIDNDIVEWLRKYKPTNVRFGHDRENKRILIKMNYTIPKTMDLKECVLSYHYEGKCFVSLHSYHFDEAFSTKVKTYMFCDDDNGSLHNFVQDGSSYCSFDNIYGNIGENKTMDSILGIIYNESYSVIKWLESIIYKLNKKDDCQELDYTHLFEEKHETPFSGNILRVYNNIVSTGELDISINNELEKNQFHNDATLEFTKPYWHLGNWNYNYLRNFGRKYKDSLLNGNREVTDDEASRLYGNYFIVEFLFNNKDNDKIEFEELQCLINNK